VRTALFLGLILTLTACGLGAPPAAAITPGASPDLAASGPRISPPPITPPTAPGTNLPAFACRDATGGATGGEVAGVVAARAAEQPGYDRFVLQFDSTVPAYSVKRQATAVFQVGASGQTVTLNGNAGVAVVVHSASSATTFQGPTDLQHPEYEVLVEARQTQDFEGFVSWGIGLSRPACMRVFILQAPARLVVDFVTTAS